MIKCKLWNGKDLKGIWEVTRKLDGVRALRQGGKVVSRNGKPLYNLDHLFFEDAEVFLGDWESSVSACRSIASKPISQQHVYSLSPLLDARLFICALENPSVESINTLLEAVLSKGDEGLVLRQDDKWLKVKPEETYDVPITGVQLGKGKYIGKLGAFHTTMGKVGTGFTDAQRQELISLPLGTTIEVSCLELTKDNKFRHPRFVRVREDK